MNKPLLNAIRLLEVFEAAQLNCTQISVWKASLNSIKNKYAKMLRKKKTKQHHIENIEQCQELILFLDSLEKSIG